MNFLDIIIVIVLILLTLGTLILQFMAVNDQEYGMIGGVFVMWLVICGFIFCVSFVSIDKKSGSTVGTITSVDKNFFGTTSLYIKTTETTEEKYCIEDNKLAEVAKENIGKKVKISYGTRVGIYSTGACNNAPVDVIEVINEENNVKGN